MSDKKNIDRLFQEKFKDFEVAPNEAVWDRINESLPIKKKKRRVIALWWQIGGVAALIALLFSVGIAVFNSDEHNAQEFPVVKTEESDKNFQQNNSSTTSDKKQKELKILEDKNTTVVDSNSKQESNLNDSERDNSQISKPSNQLTTSKDSKNKSNAVVNNSNKEKNQSSQKHKNALTVIDKSNSVNVAGSTKTSNSATDETKRASKRESEINKTLKENNTRLAENKSSEKTQSKASNSDVNKTETEKSEDLLIKIPEEQSIEDAIAENNKTISEEEKEDDRSRWSIAPNVAPVYFNSLGQGSSLDQQFNENSKSGDINMSYGIAGSYAISKKLKIRAGINRVNLNQTTSDVFAFTGAETVGRGVDASFKNISFKDGVQHVSLISSEMMNKSSAPELFNAKIAGDIDQRFGFIEVPLELEYRVLDTKFGINVIGGFSTFFLSDNEIYADVNGASALIGEANNINDTSFSANFGLGMDYSLSKQWNVNLEPTFKYQINTFNNTTGDFKPFFIGVYTGLSFKF